MIRTRVLAQGQEHTVRNIKNFNPVPYGPCLKSCLFINLVDLRLYPHRHLYSPSHLFVVVDFGKGEFALAAVFEVFQVFQVRRFQ